MDCAGKACVMLQVRPPSCDPKRWTSERWALSKYSPQRVLPSGVATICSGRVPRSILCVTRNSVSPVFNVTIAPGTAATRLPDGSTDNAWNPSRNNRELKENALEILRCQGGE